MWRKLVRALGGWLVSLVKNSEEEEREAEQRRAPPPC